jgi:hypothetical protein
LAIGPKLPRPSSTLPRRTSLRRRGIDVLTRRDEIARACRRDVKVGKANSI